MKLSASQVSSLSFSEIERRIWRGVSAYRPIGLLDRISRPALFALVERPDFSEASRSLQDWAWQTIDGLFDRESA